MSLYVHTHPYARRMLRRWEVPAEAGNCDQALAVNVREEDQTYELTALVPGLTTDDLNIQVIEDVVRIEGKFADDQDGYLLRELPSGSFRRTLRLPSLLNAEKAEARIKDGVLRLRLPKAESAIPKKIEISVK